MKKILVMLLVFLSFTVTLWAGGGSEESVVKPSPKMIESEVCIKVGQEYKVGEIFVSSNVPGVFAANLELTDEYEYYKKNQVYYVSKEKVDFKDSRIFKIKDEEGNTIHLTGIPKIGDFLGDIYPLINLDLYGKKDGKKIPIEDIDSGAVVTVTIMAQTLIDKKIEVDINELLIFTFIRDRSLWVPLEDIRSGILGDTYERSKDKVIFTITKWPVDDKMIACGH